MKKIFSIFAAALILFGAVSCKNKKDEPSAPKTTFTIEISNITDEGCDFIITPSDNTVEYMRMFMPTEQLDNNTPVEIVESTFSAQEVVYTDLKNHGHIHQGRYGDTYSSLVDDTEYVLAAFQIDENLNVVGDVALSKSFYTLPEGFVDLGLPSGTLWGRYDESNTAEGSHGFYTYTEAIAAFEDQLPTKEQWEELQTLSWSWLSSWNEFHIAGYGNSIYLDAAGRIANMATGEWEDNGKIAVYWTSTIVDDGYNDEAYYLNATGGAGDKGDFFVSGFDEQRLSVRLVALNPNKNPTIVGRVK